MSIILELIFEIGLELLLPLGAELLVELGFHSTAERIAAGPKNNVIAGFTHMVFGVVLGYLSLFIFPSLQFGSGFAAFLYFVAGPVAAGIGLSLMSWVINHGIRRAKPFELAKFIFGVLFGASFAFSRVVLG